MILYNKLYTTLHRKRIREIALYSNYPDKIQECVLKKIIKANINTQFCRQYKLSTKTTYKEFASSVPLFEYEQFHSFIKQLFKGEKKLITNDKVIYFAKSSGTTCDKSKYIPLTRNFLKTCHYKGGRDILLFYLLNKPGSKIFEGKTLSLGGKFSEETTISTYKVGDLSAHLIHNLPLWAKLFSTPPKKIALHPEWESKVKLMSNYIKKKNVTAIMGAPSWVIILLKYLLNSTNKNCVAELWPNLELFVHGGMSIKPYINSFNEIIGKPINFMEVFNASEGFFAIQNDLNSNDMLLMLDYNIFYEFIPFEKTTNTINNAISITDIELNKTYSLVITTSSGLWRYILGDTIEFTSLTPPKIIIKGRTKLFINAFGEEVIIENVEKAINEACNKTNSIVKEYTVAPLFSKSKSAGCHQWIFEFERKPPNMEYFMKIIDETLKKLNSDYETKRYKNITLDFPEFVVVKNNTFYEWLKRNNKLGGQNKIPRLCNDRNFADEILKINNEL
ncbi:MAG: GH3 auxin-responsive promoter family protein [Bacteroidales bacterium]|nr:GH3 auxin-responsive promoter family protein [Bacteroidales bacterium]